MTEAEQRAAATKFYNDWHGVGDEKSDCQRFWIEFCGNVLGIENVTQKLVFEKRVIIDEQTKFIDVYIPETRVLIEQKSINKDLNKKAQQSDGSLRTPFEQGRNYAQWMIPDETPLWIIACNFRSFEIHDMNRPNEAPVVITLEEVRHKLPLFDFMFKKEVKELSHEMEISVEAGKIVGILYDKLLEQYKDPDENSFKSLNALCVRLVFCLYAEDAGIFGSHMMFHDYLKDIPVNGFRKALLELFKILDTKTEDRDKYLAEDNPKLAAFPYVNGGLFADEDIEIPPFTEEIKELLLSKASADFDWSDISPTIFGAVFESTLNPETRRSGGMHYTSIENIHKVIDPLFMDALKSELNEIRQISVVRTKKSKLSAFQSKLAQLKFLDPACGSGNFLTETYISLRRLENDILIELQNGQIVLGEAIDPIQVSISQFYGIEINDFAVTVAKTALWIAESQMMKETEDIVHMNLDFLPLKSYANIQEGNALQLDWESIVAKNELNYIMGNPPFIGARLMTVSQKDDMQIVFGKLKGLGNLDYVSAWYKKATELIEGTSISVAFVSTNSITQGEQVAILWEQLFEKGIHIDFAYRTFKWESEAKDKAAVHCVIVGFSGKISTGKRKLFYGDSIVHEVDNINAYLYDAPNVFIVNRKKPLQDVPQMDFGSMPNDGGFLCDYSEEEKSVVVEKYPLAEKMFKRFVGATEFLHNKSRWCLWLKGISPSDIKAIPPIWEAVQKVQEMRSGSNREATRKLAATPSLFGEIRQPDKDYLIVPRHSSENRRYIPIGYADKDIICGDANMLIPDADLFSFGVLMSNVHMAWVRAICGRIKSDYRYSSAVVYNNYPWCNPTEEEKAKIEATAQGILDARALYPDSSLADLYDEILMPPELRKAHLKNDKAVMQAYGFSIRDTTEEKCVAELMKMYQDIIENIEE
ncbi:MAG: class I SAM-dependent DNA methyltransferase [Lachnospiraceae bacterium]|nr:class I SAM-dependent DNA methyltransferase [Lachnospiraceae bacterium]